MRCSRDSGVTRLRIRRKTSNHCNLLLHTSSVKNQRFLTASPRGEALGAPAPVRQITIFSSNETERYSGVRRILPGLCTHLLRAMPAAHCLRPLATSLHSAFCIFRMQQVNPGWHQPSGVRLSGHIYIQVHRAADAGDAAFVGILPHLHPPGVSHPVLVQCQPEGIVLQLA